jgi:hypothetical protein
MQPPVAAQAPVAAQPPVAVQPAPNPQLLSPGQATYTPALATPQGPPPLYPPFDYPAVRPTGPRWQPRNPCPLSARFWFTADVLLWWTKAAPEPQPLVTTGSASDAIPGALGQPGTQVIYGGNSINLPLSAGMRFETGLWIDNDRIFGVEAGYFFLGKQFRGFEAYSDGFGNPLIARPTSDAQSGTEGSYVDSYPGYVTGGLTVINRSQFQGANVGPALNLVQTDGFRLDGLLDFRYLNMAESLDITDQYADVQPGALTFGGQNIRWSDFLSDFDTFKTTNSFYGGSLGARTNWSRGRWVFGATGKVAIGTMQERTVIQGWTTLNTASGAQFTLPGGILASTANIGNYYRSPFAVVPEAYLNLGFQLNPWVTLRLGYSFIYLSNVLRPGNQVNRTTSANLIPSDPTYGSAGPNQPAYQFHASSYWAQGMNVGLDCRF